MTYRELIEKIPENQLDNDVTIYDDYEEEYHPMIDWGLCEDGVLDDNHFYIVF